MTRLARICVRSLCTAIVLAGLISPAALAHSGACSGQAFEPDKNPGSGTVSGTVGVTCFGNLHDRYKVFGCLQRKISGTWTNVNCDTADTGTNANTAGFQNTFGADCHTGDWRMKFLEGWVYNNAGDLAHHPTTNELSSVRTVNSC